MPSLVESGVEFDVETIARALVNIYKQQVDIDHDIEQNLYRDTLRIMGDAMDNGFAQAAEDGVSVPDQAFRDAFTHSAEVFSAFRVHKMQNDIAAQMLDSDGNVKPFSRFVKDVSPYIEHRNRAWLRTEYDTAIIRARNAAEWQQFQDEKDVYPNLEWIPSTSPNPGADHRVFWGTVLPVDDPFWDEHKPGDRWNCKCELRQTDKGCTAAPSSDGKSDAAPGLESNPAKNKEVFSDNHPYFPSSCSTCPFAGNKLMALAHDLAGKGKHCMSCKAMNGCIDRANDEYESPTLITLRKFDSGGSLSEYSTSEPKKPDYSAIKRIGRLFAEEKGEEVILTPRVNRKNPAYEEIYGSLIGTIYENKCPDLKIGDHFYEYEGYEKEWKKVKVGRMLSHGAVQASRVIINNTHGCSDRFIRKQIIARQHQGDVLEEVWLYENGNVRPFLVDGRFL